MWGFDILCVKPLTHISFRCEVPVPSVSRVNLIFSYTVKGGGC